MNNIIAVPNPLINSRELSKIDTLTKEYEKFIEPGAFSKFMSSVAERVDKIIPENIKHYLENIKDVVSEAELIQEALIVVAKGFVEIESRAAQLTISKQAVVDRLRKENPEILSYDDICFARGYEIEKSLNLKDLEDLLYAGVQGGATGFFGFYGIPVNIVLCTFLFFRAVQNIALHYGYDVQDDPSELEIASTITMQALNPNVEAAAGSLSSLIGKMMIMTKATALNQGLNKTYTEMINKGGIQLLYVQIRALANNAAKKALEKAGNKGLEKTMYSEILEQIGRHLSKSAGKKVVPVVGSFIGLLFDTAYMSRVLKYAKIVYHKRYLLEKEQRIMSVIDKNNRNQDDNSIGIISI